MTSVSVAEAKNNLSSLIERALAGEQVIITRHGREVIEMRAIETVPRAAISRSEIRQRRLSRSAISKSAADILNEMYDEER